MTVPTTAEASSLPERIASVVTSNPSVARLDGGEFGTVATYLP